MQHRWTLSERNNLYFSLFLTQTYCLTLIVAHKFHKLLLKSFYEVFFVLFGKKKYVMAKKYRFGKAGGSVNNDRPFISEEVLTEAYDKEVKKVSGKTNLVFIKHAFISLASFTSGLSTLSKVHFPIFRIFKVGFKWLFLLSRWYKEQKHISQQTARFCRMKQTRQCLSLRLQPIKGSGDHKMHRHKNLSKKSREKERAGAREGENENQKRIVSFPRRWKNTILLDKNVRGKYSIVDGSFNENLKGNFTYKKSLMHGSDVVGMEQRQTFISLSSDGENL